MGGGNRKRLEKRKDMGYESEELLMGSPINGLPKKRVHLSDGWTFSY